MENRIFLLIVALFALYLLLTPKGKEITKKFTGWMTNGSSEQTD